VRSAPRRLGTARPSASRPFAGAIPNRSIAQALTATGAQESWVTIPLLSVGPL